jgi:hypothetical protein
MTSKCSIGHNKGNNLYKSLEVSSTNKSKKVINYHQFVNSNSMKKTRLPPSNHVHDIVHNLE